MRLRAKPPASAEAALTHPSRARPAAHPAPRSTGSPAGAATPGRENQPLGPRLRTWLATAALIIINTEDLPHLAENDFPPPTRAKTPRGNQHPGGAHLQKHPKRGLLQLGEGIGNTCAQNAPAPSTKHQQLTAGPCPADRRSGNVVINPRWRTETEPAELAPITRGREAVRLCDWRTAGEAHIPTGDTATLREAWAQASLCPVCQLNSGYPPFHLQKSRYRASHRALAHLYTVPVLNDLDNIRNCPHCRQSPSDRKCRAWQEARKGVRALRQEARRFAREVTEIKAAIGGCAATIYQFLDGSVGYFAPDAPMWREAGEVTGQDLDRALEVLHQQGVPGGKVGWREDSKGNRLGQRAIGARRYAVREIIPQRES